ncbi:MAG: asparagine synthase (glutamine-hydrolyzing) [Polyangiaceae bacterium]|nr:asparagine synthase (glutamine-hydrolyzing) [Polyangiaceae bacterium]
MYRTIRAGSAPCLDDPLRHASVSRANERHFCRSLFVCHNAAMCGIAGILWSGHQELGNSVATVRRMTDALSHRGPDGAGVFARSATGALLENTGTARPPTSQQLSVKSAGQSLALGHRRLSIIDLEGGAQPMSEASGRIWVTFNGEIYNYPELRAQLEAEGCVFRTQSDTESILHAYQRWGHSCVEHLHGMFAFALWDEADQSLFLARDRLGIKPLLFAHTAEGFLFASELKGLLASGLLNAQVRPSGIKRFLHNLYIPAPEGPLEGVGLLEPGHTLLLRNGQERKERYWKLDFSPGIRRSDTDWLADFDRTLRDAVRSHRLADVPLGAFLSGGLDSSAVTALLSAPGQAPVLTTTVGFDDVAFDESEDAQRVANHLGTDHAVVRVTNPDIEAALERVLSAYDQPFADQSAIATFLLCQGARQRMKVALAGDGADELLAGYPRHRHYLALEALRTISGPLSAAAGKVLVEAGSRLQGRGRRVADQTGAFLGSAPRKPDTTFSYGYLRNAFRGGLFERLATEEFQQETAAVDPWEHLHRIVAQSHAPNRMQGLLEMEIHSYLPNDILHKVDIASMAFGLEVRVPFLDHRLVELAAKMPLHLKWNGRQTKVALRRSVAALLPSSTFKKTKQGFHPPIASWFRTSGRTIVQETLLSQRALERGYFRRHVLEALISDHLSSQHNHGPQLWALLQLEFWHRNFVDTHP